MWNQQYNGEPVRDYDQRCIKESAQDENFLDSLYKKKKYWVAPGMHYQNRNDFQVDDDGRVIVYTDGACPSNGRHGATAGIGVWFGHDHNLNVSKPLGYHDDPTNQVAEIRAAIKAIKVAKKHGVGRLAIHTDSGYLVNSMTKYIFKWLTNEWLNAKGLRVLHRELFRDILFAMRGMNVDWIHVKGHDEDPDIVHRIGNNEADFLAREGAKYY